MMRSILRDTAKFVIVFVYPYWIPLPKWVYNDGTDQR